MKNSKKVKVREVLAEKIHLTSQEVMFPEIFEDAKVFVSECTWPPGTGENSGLIVVFTSLMG